MSTISRRDLFKFGGVAAVGAAGASMLSACARQGSAAGHGRIPPTRAPRPRTGCQLLREAGAHTDILETKDYDVVVVGAGAAGVPAALSAFEAGAKVALLQKEATAISQGNTCDSIILDQTDPAGVEAVVSLITEDCCHRSDREQVRLWAYNSGEALQWLWDIAQKAGAQVVDSTAKWTGPIKQIDGYDITYFAFDFGPKPYQHGQRHARHRRLRRAAGRRYLLLHPCRAARAERRRRGDGRGRRGQGRLHPVQRVQRQ